MLNVEAIGMADLHADTAPGGFACRADGIAARVAADTQAGGAAMMESSSFWHDESHSGYTASAKPFPMSSA